METSPDRADRALRGPFLKIILIFFIRRGLSPEPVVCWGYDTLPASLRCTLGAFSFCSYREAGRLVCTGYSLADRRIVPDMNSPMYPPVSEAVDNHLSDMVKNLDASVQKGFEKVDRRISEMVTQGEFRATVERLDAAQDAARSHTEAKILAVEGVFTQKAHELEGGLSEAEKRRSEDQGRFRWVLTVAVSVVGIVLTGVNFVMNTLLK